MVQRIRKANDLERQKLGEVCFVTYEDGYGEYIKDWQLVGQDTQGNYRYVMADPRGWTKWASCKKQLEFILEY